MFDAFRTTYQGLGDETEMSALTEKEFFEWNAAMTRYYPNLDGPEPSNRKVLVISLSRSSSAAESLY